MPETEKPPEDHSPARTTDFYTSFIEQLTGVEPIESDPAVDGAYWLAKYYFGRVASTLISWARRNATHFG